MGGSHSKVTTKTVDNVVSEAIAKSVMVSSASASGSEAITISGNDNTVCKNSFGETLTVISAGDFTNKMAADLQNTISAKLKSLASSSSNAFGVLSGSRSTSDTEIDNSVKDVFSMTNIQKCLGNLNLNETLKITGSGNDVCSNQFKQVGVLMVKCLGTNKTTQTALNKLSTHVVNTAKSKNQSLLGSLLGSDSDLKMSSISSLVILVVIGVGFTIYYFSGRGRGSDGGDNASDVSMADDGGAFETAFTGDDTTGWDNSSTISSSPFDTD